MIRLIHDIPFEVQSPSHLRLAGTGRHTVDLSYIDHQEWLLAHETPEGQVSTALFRSRDAAIVAVKYLLRQ